MSYLKRKYPTFVIIALVIIFCLIYSFVTGNNQEEKTEAGAYISEHGALQVVTTTTLLRDLVSTIGGDRVAAVSLMGPGVDPHLYQASAGDVRRLQSADLVVYHGLMLEGKMGDIFAALTSTGQGAVICAADGLAPDGLIARSESADLYDPHIWFDVALWQQTARHLCERLCAVDPSNADGYRARLERYLLELSALDEEIQRRAGEIPVPRRILVTAHAAFSYFGRAYGFEVRGLQGVSTDAEAGTADVSALADWVVAQQVPAIFAEASLSPKQMEALGAAIRARGADVAMGGTLYTDALGGPGSGAETYAEMMRANLDMLTGALQ